MQQPGPGGVHGHHGGAVERQLVPGRPGQAREPPLDPIELVRPSRRRSSAPRRPGPRARPFALPLDGRRAWEAGSAVAAPCRRDHLRREARTPGRGPSRSRPESGLTPEASATRTPGCPRSRRRTAPAPSPSAPGPCWPAAAPTSSGPAPPRPRCGPARRGARPARAHPGGLRRRLLSAGRGRRAGRPGPLRPPRRGGAAGGRAGRAGGGGAGHRAVARPRPSTRCWPRLDPAGADPASRHFLEKSLRDFRRAGVDRDDADARRRPGAAGGAGPHRPGLRPQHQGRPAQRPGPARGARRPARGLARRPPARGRRPGRGEHRSRRLRPLHDLRAQRGGPGGALELSRQRAHPANVEVLAALLGKRAELARLLG